MTYFVHVTAENSGQLTVQNFLFKKIQSSSGHHKNSLSNNNQPVVNIQSRPALYTRLHFINCTVSVIYNAPRLVLQALLSVPGPGRSNR